MYTDRKLVCLESFLTASLLKPTYLLNLGKIPTPPITKTPQGIRDLTVDCEFWLKLFSYGSETVKAETEKQGVFSKDSKCEWSAATNMNQS